MSQDGDGGDAGGPADGTTEATDVSTEGNGTPTEGDGAPTVADDEVPTEDDGVPTEAADFPTVEGLGVDEAVDRIVGADPARDPQTVQQALANVADDGVVAESAVQDALGHLSKVVSTPETRVELAAMALDEARDAADPVADLDAVRSRLHAYESTLADLEDRLDDLRGSLQAVVERGSDPDSLYAVGRDVQRVTEEANAVQQRADELQLDLEEFESWLDDPDARTAQLDRDADSVETTVADLHDVADALAAVSSAEESASGDGTERDEGSTGSDAGSTASDDDSSTVSVPGPVEITDPAVAWVDATFRQRVVELLLADLRAELADLREWNEREDVADSGLDDAADRLADLDDRAAALADRLDELARPAWSDRYGDRLASFDERLGDPTAPVDWARVEATLAEHRSSLIGDA